MMELPRVEAYALRWEHIFTCGASFHEQFRKGKEASTRDEWGRCKKFYRSDNQHLSPAKPAAG
jgi:hypothetical protein